ncbi:MAG: DUF881 domain-containing protein [Peptococcaceae bacterium]
MEYKVIFKNKSIYIIMAFIALSLGFTFALQFRTNTAAKQNLPLQQTQELAARLKTTREENEALQNRVDKLRQQLDQVTDSFHLTTLHQELSKARIAAGMTELTGPGAEVTLSDSNKKIQPGENPNLYVLHDEDILKVVNELKAAGAEAIALNGQRLLATSEIRCLGPTVLTNKNQRLTPPFIITAIGSPDNLVSALQMRGGVIDQLRFWEIQVAVKSMPNITIPAYPGRLRFDYAKPES